MSDIAILDVFLHDQLIGKITHLPDDRNLFTFNQNYRENPARPILSLSYKDVSGDLIFETKMTRTCLSPFFSNVLPEDRMREYLASQAGVNPEREFFLMAALGKDLPGALKIYASGYQNTALHYSDDMEKAIDLENKKDVLHFSLAGVQLKLSAIQEESGRLTIPANGIGGSWIVKLPSPAYPGLPENEYAMMELARAIGITVPKTALVPLNSISGLPKKFPHQKNNAFIIKRFDRTSEGRAVHFEDFAQVFGVYPEKKYRAASYVAIAKVILAETGELGFIEFVRRFVFNALIGNGDMHLKNWSLIYPDGRKADIAPAYDFVSTIPYLSEDQLALNFVDTKAFTSLDLDLFVRFATKVQVPKTLVLDTVQDTVHKFCNVWPRVHNFSLPQEMVQQITGHFQKVPFFSQFS